MAKSGKHIFDENCKFGIFFRKITNLATCDPNIRLWVEKKSPEIAKLAIFASKTTNLVIFSYFWQNIVNLAISGENLATYKVYIDLVVCHKSPNRQFPQKRAKLAIYPKWVSVVVLCRSVAVL